MTTVGTAARGGIVAGMIGVSLTFAHPASAHTGGTSGFASIAIDGAVIRYGLTLWPATLPPTVAAELTARPETMLDAVRAKVAFVAQGHRCAAGPGSVSRARGDSVTLAVSYTCPAPPRDLHVRDDLFDVLGADHHTLARIEAPGHAGQFAFATEARETRVRLGRGEVGGFASFVWLGIEHIVMGWDHLVFLLALLLPGGSALAIVKIVTAFTAAHSGTLALAVLDIAALPDRLVEAAIALSIAAVALENLWLTPSVTRRWVLSFGFGLVHGFGFSSVLRDIGLPADGLLLSLFGFNAGVELGQMLAVVAAIPVLMAVRKTGHGKRMVRGSSVAILVAGVVLFVERALL